MEKIKGRPALPGIKQKRLHYSVWLNEEQKLHIDKQVSKSNLSASQYILAQLELAPVQLPARKDIPDHISRQIINLEKLSGILAFNAHRTKDRELISREWMMSSQLIRRLSELVSKWLFEEFSIPGMRAFFEENDKSVDKLLLMISTGEATQEQKEYLAELNRIKERNGLMRHRYVSYYDHMDHDLSIFQVEKVVLSGDVQKEIRNLVRSILESL